MRIVIETNDAERHTIQNFVDRPQQDTESTNSGARATDDRSLVAEQDMDGGLPSQELLAEIAAAEAAGQYEADNQSDIVTDAGAGPTGE